MWTDPRTNADWAVISSVFSDAPSQRIEFRSANTVMRVELPTPISDTLRTLSDVQLASLLDRALRHAPADSQ